MLNKLRADPVIRKNYQFWFYSYPSGYPFAYSAAILRDELDEVEKQFPKLKPMVLIGHGMGGCISRLLLTDSGDELWLKILAKNARVFSSGTLSTSAGSWPCHFHRFAIARKQHGQRADRDVISDDYSRIGAEQPGQSGDASSDKYQEDELKPKRRANSVDSLSPKSRFLNALNTIPMTSGVPYHTIIGDRGRGDSPNSSDGVVPY